MPIDRFLKYLTNERMLSRLTIVSYETDLKQWSEFLERQGKAVDQRSVKAVDVRMWLVERADAGDGPRTLRRKTQALRALYKYLMKMGVVEENPAAAVELAKLPKRLPEYVREQSINSLIDAEIDEGDFEQVRNRLMLMMFYETGIRRAELISLKDANVDTVQCELRVHGKRDKDRVVPFGNELRRWIELYRGLRADCGLVGQAEEFFVKFDGGALYPMLVHRVITGELATAQGNGRKSPHVLRHTFASAMLNDGAGINSVKELLGHESLSATQIYTHITFEGLKDNYNHAHPRAIKKGG